LVSEALAGRPIEPRLLRPDCSRVPDNQLVVYARELSELFERERIERQALEEARRRLEGLDRLKAAFLGVVTHELLTPFAAIGLALEILQHQGGRLLPDQRSALDGLVTEIAGLHRLVSGVVKFAELLNKRREPQPGSISLDRLIPWAVQPVAVLAQAREVDFRVCVSSNLPKVYADPELLDEAVFQMAHNAVKFNLPGGWARVGALEADGWVVIEVADTGVGLTPERLATLGQPFEQEADAVQRGREGLGIGWAFVRYVAEVHGGRTQVESPGPGQGSVFSLSLPAAAKGQELQVDAEEGVRAFVN
jgi:signal transduction histidine kinase